MPDKIPRYKTRILLHPSGFEVTSFHDFYRSKKAKERISKLHRVPFYQIFWFKEDNNSCYVNGDKIIVEKNSLLVLNKDVVHKFSQNILDGEIILFSNNFFRSTQEKIDFLNTCPLFKNAYSVIKPHTDDFASLLDIYFSFMKRDIDKNKNRELSVCRNLLHNLLMIAEREFKLQRKVFGKSPYSNYIAQFKSLLIEHYKTQKQVSFYAQAMEVSERKLSMMVSKRFGISAKEYINEKVFREAKRLLKYSTLNEKEIAHTIGFDLTYFIKFFKKYNDTTPGRFRNK